MLKKNEDNIDFTSSWDETLSFYEELIDTSPELAHLAILYLFIKKLRITEENNFRIDHKMQDLILSRSAEKSLRKEQEFISIRISGGLFEISLKKHNKLIKQYTVKDLDDERVSGILEELKLIEID